MSQCMNCGRNLTPDEKGLHRKLFNRAAESFMCIDCCAAYLSVPRECLEKKIEEYKELGCTLFDVANDSCE